MTRRTWFRSVAGMVAAACAAPLIGIGKAAGVLEDVADLAWLRFGIRYDSDRGVLEYRYRLNGGPWRTIRKIVPRNDVSAKMGPITVQVHPTLVADGEVNIVDNFGNDMPTIDWLRCVPA